MPKKKKKSVKKKKKASKRVKKLKKKVVKKKKTPVKRKKTKKSVKKKTQKKKNKTTKSKKTKKSLVRISKKAKKLKSVPPQEKISIFKKAKKAVMKKLSPRAGSGIKTFDSMTGGGYERESINLIVGGSGSGKSIFALQFILEGIKKGEKGLYVSFEEQKDEFFRNMKKLGLDLEKLEKSGKFIYLEHSPEKVKMMLDEGGGSIESIVLKNQIRRLVIDSITSFSLLFDDRLSKRQANLGLFDIIGKWNTTTLLTVQEDPSNPKGETLSSVEFEVDGVTLLYYTSVKGRRKRFLEILKMRGTNHSKDIREFKISKGIKIGRKTSAKVLGK